MIPQVSMASPQKVEPRRVESVEHSKLGMDEKRKKAARTVHRSCDFCVQRKKKCTGDGVNACR